jgi:hypothetical protein
MNICVFQVDIQYYLTGGAETTDDIGLPALRVPPVSSSVSYYAINYINTNWMQQ